MNNRELTGRTALVTGVTRRAGIGAAIARELGRAGARPFVTFFRHYDRKQVWGVELMRCSAGHRVLVGLRRGDDARVRDLPRIDLAQTLLLFVAVVSRIALRIEGHVLDPLNLSTVTADVSRR